jgi:hypothetical protein
MIEMGTGCAHHSRFRSGDEASQGYQEENPYEKRVITHEFHAIKTKGFFLTEINRKLQPCIWYFKFTYSNNTLA